jgi:hypothetical protein
MYALGEKLFELKVSADACGSADQARAWNDDSEGGSV